MYLRRGIRGQTQSSMGESFFFSCTKHVSMYLHRGIVIHSFFHSFVRSFCPAGYYFLIVSSGITRDLLLTPTGTCLAVWACRGQPAQVMYVRHSVCRHAGAYDQRLWACRGQPAQVM